MPLPPRLQDFLDDLSVFSDRSERIDALISIGQQFTNASADEVPRTPERRVPGCESEVFIASKPEGEGLRYTFAVDNPQGISAMALAEVVNRTLTGEKPSVVAQIPEEVVYQIFGNELSMGKSMGLMGMIRMVKAEAAKAA